MLDLPVEALTGCHCQLVFVDHSNHFLPSQVAPSPDWTLLGSETVRFDCDVRKQTAQLTSSAGGKYLLNSARRGEKSDICTREGV